MIWLDFLSAFSSLRRQPGFSITVILALAAGIGANASLFSVINGLLFRPFAYREPSEIVEIQHSRRPIPIENLARASTLATGLGGAAAFNAANFQIMGAPGGPVTRRFGFRVTPNLFAVLGVDPVIGRPFDIRPDAEPAVMLAYEYWRTEWNGDPDVAGKTLTIGASQYVIAGVMPANFTLQVRDSYLFVASDGRTFTDGRLVARRRADASIDQVRSEVEAIFRALPAGSGPSARRETQVLPIQEAFLPGDAVGVIFFQGAVALVLLITCANVGNLMLARSIRRSREFAIRSAMGASGGRLLRQLLVESGILAAAGGVVGLGFAAVMHDLLESWLPMNIQRMLRGPDATAIDLRVTAFTIAVSMAAVLFFGLAPSLNALRIDVITHLKAASRSTTSRNQRLGQFLVGAEVALAVMLLIGAGLMLKSVVQLSGAYLGFTDEHVLRAAIDLSPQRHPTPEHRVAAYRAIVNELAILPGVESVGVLGPQLFPFGGPRVRGAEFIVQGSAPSETPRAEVYTATPDYFKTLQIPLLRGRMFDRNDTAASEPVTLLSDVVARRTFGNGVDPIGRRVRFDLRDPASPWITVVGIVGDVRNPIGADVQPTAYRPWEQNATSGGIFYIRTNPRGAALSYAPAIRKVLRDADPVAPEFRIVDLSQSVGDYISPQRFSARLLGGFAIFGLLLAGAGVYGVMRYWVQARVPEIGIRLALGAQKAGVVRLVLARAALASGIGGVAGLAGAYALHRVMDSQLHGVSSTDPLVFAAVALIMVLTALAAAYLPARFASGVDPLVALREE